MLSETGALTIFGYYVSCFQYVMWKYIIKELLENIVYEICLIIRVTSLYALQNKVLHIRSSCKQTNKQCVYAFL